MDNELPYPDWQASAQEVLLEMDGQRLIEKARRAEDKIFLRLRELQESSNGHLERDALGHALSLIREIKRSRLGP